MSTLTNLSPTEVRTVIQAPAPIRAVVQAAPAVQTRLVIGQGPAGVSLPGSGDLSYQHTQASAASTWSITHNLGKHPSVSVVDSAGDGVEGDIEHLNLNALVLRFSAAFAGMAYLN